jgi:hypothetical protein
MPTPERTLQNAVVASDEFGRRVPVETAPASPPAGTFDASRRALTRTDIRGLGAIQRTVSLPSGPLTETSWSDGALQLHRLSQENEILRRRLSAAEDRSRTLQAQLDSLAQRP